MSERTTETTGAGRAPTPAADAPDAHHAADVTSTPTTDVTTVLPRTEQDPDGADHPGELSAGDWRATAKAVAARVKSDNILLLGAGVAFWALLALIPSLIAAVSIYGLVSDPADVQRQIEDLSTTLPDSASGLLNEQLDSIVNSSSGSLSFGLVFGLAAALFSASGGINQLIAALNVAYGERETRNIAKVRGLSLLLTFGAIVFAAFAISAIAVIPALLARVDLDGVARATMSWLRWPLLLVGFLAALALLYKVGPDRKDPKLSWTSWGAGIATAIWVLGSLLFSFYVSNFGTFNETYGSLAGVIVLMLWLFLSSTIIIIGAVINAELEGHLER